jgi:hypothetical protein
MRQVPKRGLTLLVVLGIASMFLNIYGSTTLSVYTHSDILETAVDLPSRRPYCPPNDDTDDNMSKETTIHNKTAIVVVYLNQTTTVPRLFHCGGHALNRNLQPTLQSLLPEYEWRDLRKVQDWKSLQSNPWDIFVSNYQLDECGGSTDVAFHVWLQLHYQGKVVFWTPEDATNYQPVVQRPNYYLLGPGAPLTLTFLQTAFWAQLSLPDKHKIILDDTATATTATVTSKKKQHHHPSARPRSTGQHFLIYAHSHCVGERQSAFRQIANAGLPTVHYGGRCDGGVKKNQTKATHYPNQVRLANWEDNRRIYQNFRFCLTMEHVSAPGYITEKILVAFLGGCLPIYWGTTEIWDIFHWDSFIVWDVHNPQPALDRIRYLEQNRTAYEEVFQHPILAPGALEKYFSLGDDDDDDFLGGGVLKARIRRYLGLEEFEFVDRS